MKHDFVIRIYKDQVNNPTLSSLQNITISDITILSKPSKYDNICEHKSNQKKFGYTFTLSKKFNFNSGSHSTPTLTFKGEYIDIIVKNFPRYPAFYQSNSAARNIINGYKDGLNQGFPHQLLYRKIEFNNL